MGASIPPGGCSSFTLLVPETYPNRVFKAENFGHVSPLDGSEKE